MKKMNRKGFTLIELLAVIVVLAIILVITVPMVLNSLSSTRQDALQSSANSVAKYIEEQIGLAALDKSELFTLNTDIWFNTTTGKVCASGSSSSTCATSGTAIKLSTLTNKTLLGLNDTDYNLASSTATWGTDGRVTVVLYGKSGGKFMNGTTALTATSGVK